MKIEEYLKAVEEKIKFWIDELGDEYISEIFSSIKSGKMVRSQLMFLISKDEKMVALSAVIELIHLASLLHDDVIDDAEQRRGVPSVHATEGSKVSIMLGDILYSKAFVELGSYSETIIKDIANGVVKLSMGEIADVNLSKEFNSDENLYLNMIYNKTASLIEVACRVSAIHSGKDGVKFGEYGKWLGMAFQIIDDILDIVSTSEELGKPAMNDFIEGKTTLPYIYLYKEAPHLREKVKSFHLKTLSEDEQEWIKEQFEESGSLEKAMDLAIEFSEKAIKNLEKENGELLDIVQNLIERKK